MEWIDPQEKMPKDGQELLIKILYQRFVGGAHCEDCVVVTGGIIDGDWFVGNQMIMWDFDYNLGFSADDVIAWCDIGVLDQ